MIQVITIDASAFHDIIADAARKDYRLGRKEANILTAPDPDEWVSFEQVAK